MNNFKPEPKVCLYFNVNINKDTQFTQAKKQRQDVL